MYFVSPRMFFCLTITDVFCLTANVTCLNTSDFCLATNAFCLTTNVFLSLREYFLSHQKCILSHQRCFLSHQKCILSHHCSYFFPVCSTDVVRGRLSLDTRRPRRVVSDRFISLGLMSGLIYRRWRSLDFYSRKLKTLAKVFIGFLSFV